jgi:hypothetical protein
MVIFCFDKNQAGKAGKAGRRQAMPIVRRKKTRRSLRLSGSNPSFVEGWRRRDEL